GQEKNRRLEDLLPAPRAGRSDQRRRMGPAQLRESRERAAGRKRRIRRLLPQPGRRAERDSIQGMVMKTKRGFTLIELMVVLTVIALLLWVVVPVDMGMMRRAKEAVLQQNLALMRDSPGNYYPDR